MGRDAHLSGRHGFTLVELLVVMAIVAMLMAILLPALAKARQSAYAIKCATQLRQNGAALFAYAVDNKEWAPDRSPTRVPSSFMGLWINSYFDRHTHLCPTDRSRPNSTNLPPEGGRLYIHSGTQTPVLISSYNFMFLMGPNLGGVNHAGVVTADSFNHDNFFGYRMGQTGNINDSPIPRITLMGVKGVTYIKNNGVAGHTRNIAAPSVQTMAIDGYRPNEQTFGGAVWNNSNSNVPAASSRWNMHEQYGAINRLHGDGHVKAVSKDLVTGRYGYTSGTYDIFW